MLISVYINSSLYYFPQHISVLEACRSVGIQIPRFCYHENLSIAGNCRMCLVEIQEISKPLVACSTDVLENMIIYTKSPLVLKSRENILEFMLLNHPLDCPICDQAGECDLQDQSTFFGNNSSRNYFNRRAVEDKFINHIIKTVMTRCIHCTKCVRFGEEICGVKFLGTLNRGTNTEIGNYIIRLAISEISANIIDLCPVGALTLQIVPFQVRPWEVQLIDSIDLSDSFGSNTFLTYRGFDLLKVTPKKNKYINELWLTNKARFYFELTLNKDTSPSFNNILPYSSLLKCPILFLYNSEFDLKTLQAFKYYALKNININFRVFNSTIKQTNFYFNTFKPKISLIDKKNYILLLLVSNIHAELPLLNIRIKSSLSYLSRVIQFGSNNTGNFPVTFARFTVEDILFFLKGVHPIFSFFSYATNILFTNKVIANRLDFNLIQELKFKNHFQLYTISLFCNSESSNILNFKKFNLKELQYSSQTYFLGLDDSFLIRKYIIRANQIFWVNNFFLDILDFLPAITWINLEIHQVPGIYINLEQRPQNFLLLKTNYTFSIITFLNYLFSLLNLNSTVFLKNFEKFNFKHKLWNLNMLKEINIFKNLFNINLAKNFYFLTEQLVFSNSKKFFFKYLPFKLIFEDTYRTVLQCKASSSARKSSQTLRLNQITLWPVI